MNSKASNPYVGSRTFEEGERDRFFGRDTEARDLLALVVSERLVVFYAQSGAGKSSLVNTCLIPDLRDRGYEIFTGRVVGDAPNGIQPDNIFAFNLLRSLAAKERNAAPLASQTISGFLKQHTGTNTPGTDEESLSNVLIVDQFEEIFSTHHEEWEKREGFFKQLAQALEDDRYLSIVLVMREDYIASLDPYSPLVPNRFRRRYYMQRLEREAALEAVKKPVEGIRPYEDGVAERLVNDLSSIKIQRADETTETQPGQFVEGVQLQLVCFKLWKGLDAGDHITHADLDKLGDVNLALEEHYAERVREVAELKKVSERDIREWFGKKLITSNGTRNMVLRNTRKVEGELPDHVIQALQSDLVRAEQRGAAAFYELTHDRLVEPILANNKKWSENLSPLQRQAALWNDQGRNETWLFGDQALAEAEVWAKDHQGELTQTEKEFLKESRTKQKEREKEQQARQRRIITVLSVVAILVTSGLAFFGIVQANRATREAIVAQANLFVAETAGAESELNAFAALTQQSIAEAEKAKAEEQLKISRAGQLAAQSQRLATVNLQNSFLLAVEAFNSADTLQSRSVLLESALASPQLIQFLPEHTDGVTSVAFSPDGKILASGSSDNTIMLWNMETRQSIGSLKGHTEDVSSVAFSPDGKILASGSGDSTVILWDVDTQQPIIRLTGHAGYVSSAAFSPDGRILASGSYNNDIILWDVQTGKEIVRFSLPSYVSTLTFSPDGKTLAAGSGDNIITLWNIDSGRQIAQLTEHTNSVTTVAFSPDGSKLASGSYDNTIILWDVKTREPFDRLNGDSGSSFTTVAFSADSTILASGSTNNTATLWDVATGQPVAQLTGHSNVVSSVAFSPDGKTLASGSTDSTVILWSLETSQGIAQPLVGHTDYISSAAFSPDGQTLATASNDGTIILWDVDAQAPVDPPLLWDQESTQSFILPSTGGSYISGIAFSPDGKTLASASSYGTIILWDVQTHQVVGESTGNSSSISSIAFSPDGSTLASTSGDNTIILWDVETLKPLSQFEGNKDSTYISGVFSPDGNTFASGGCRKFQDEVCIQGEITLWDMDIRESINQLIGHTSFISTVAFNSNGTTLASGSNDGSIILWDLEKKQPIDLPLTGHSYYVSSVAFSPDGKTLASGSFDGTIILWDVETRQPIGQPLTEYYASISSVAFSPDGMTLASGTYNNVTLWDLNSNSWIDQTCQRAGRNFTRSEWERFFPGEEYEKTCPQWPLELEVEATEIASETPVISLATASVTLTAFPATATFTPGTVPAIATSTPTAIRPTATEIPSRTPTATATKIVLYLVINVKEGIDLNIRAGPGVNYNIVGEIPFNGSGIQVTGDWVRADKTIWYPITYNGISGWVDGYYLAPE